MKAIKLFLILLSLSCAFAASSQTALLKMVETLEKSPVVKDEMYLETRDPKTHKLTNTTRVFKFDNEQLVKQAIEAFKKDRPNSVEYRCTDNPGKLAYVANFEKGKEMSSFYFVRLGRNKYGFTYRLWTKGTETR